MKCHHRNFYTNKHFPIILIMLGNHQDFSDSVKIHPIKTKMNAWKKNHEMTPNFQEFQRVYGWLLKTGDSSARHQSNAKKISERRALVDLKTIRLEMPTLGSEQAIIVQPDKSFAMKRTNKIPHVERINKAATSTKNLVEKLTELELPTRKTSQNTVNKSDFLEQTNKDLRIATTQLEQIKSAMQLRQVEKQKRPKTPTFKSKKKSYRHNECVKKKYLTTLSLMQAKLQALEKKYFDRPKITYKSVNDIFTQSSEKAETIIEKSSSEHVKIDETLTGIMTELEELMNAGVEEKYHETNMQTEDKQSDGSFYSERDPDHSLCDDFFVSVPEDEISLEIPQKNDAKDISTLSTTAEEETKYHDEITTQKHIGRKSITNQWSTDSFSALIDASEFQMRKYRNMKQDIIDVESFCQKIFNLTTTDEDHDDEVGEENELFDGGHHQLANSVLNSSYLKKEFDVQPKINYFYDTYGASDKCSETSVKSIKTLIRSLSSALENSIYQAVDTE